MSATGTSDDSAATREPELTRLYDGLSRYQWWRRKLARARPGEQLAMRKRLRAGEGALAGAEQLNDWLWRLAGVTVAAPRVLDLGAGFGDTLLHWARQHAGEYLGLGLSPYQVERAKQQADALGAGDRCRFLRQPFDAPLDGGFDLIVAVETLFHAPDLRHSLQGVAARLVPGGVMVLVEDMAKDAAVAASPAGRELLARWSTPRLHSHADYEVGLRAAGLELEVDHDLSELLILADTPTRARRRRRLGVLRALVPLGRQVLDAFLGGLAMEDLQARGDLRYHAMRARRPRA